MSAVDEMVDGSGGVRPHWRGVLAAVSSLDYPVLTERARRLQVGSEADGGGASWRCDPVPLPLSTPEFARLEAGLSQRARLLEAMLADVYGAQRMLSEGWLPPQVLHANPVYLRACLTRPAHPPERVGPMLQTFAADLMRGPDGQWCVIADWTGGALGIGYARECRRDAGAGVAGAVPLDAGAAAAAVLRGVAGHAAADRGRVRMGGPRWWRC